jgi:hypothetical protein
MLGLLRRTLSDAQVQWRSDGAQTRVNDAMRQRIRVIAASCDLSDEEIKPVLRLKHEEVGRFTECTA